MSKTAAEMSDAREVTGDNHQVTAGQQTTDSIFGAIEPPTVFERTIERLGQAIALGLIPPGTQLPTERDLAKRLKVSRPTLRQALAVLQQSGYLESRRGRAGGTWVVNAEQLAALIPAPLDANWNESLDYRIAIEVGCAVLASERITPAHEEALAQTIREMDAAESFDEFRRADIRFHLGLAECTGSQQLVDCMVEAQTCMTRLFAHMVERPRMVWLTSNEQHKKVLRALVKGDSATAARLSREHVEASRSILAGLSRIRD